MRYLLMISADEEIAERSMAEGRFESFTAWLSDLHERGVLRAHEGLHLSGTATTVRVRGGDVLLTDGPFIEGKEQIGGLALIECADLDEAIGIAAGHPAAQVGQVEVRPVRELPPELAPPDDWSTPPAARSDPPGPRSDPLGPRSDPLGPRSGAAGLGLEAAGSEAAGSGSGLGAAGRPAAAGPVDPLAPGDR